MNRYETRCPHFNCNCPHMEDPSDKCTFNGECIRDTVLEQVIKADKKCNKHMNKFRRSKFYKGEND